MIPYGRQDINQDDVDRVVEVLNSEYLTQGPTVPRFEKKITELVGANFGIAVNSATSALHISCLALGLNQDDILWTVPNTFVASANCGLYCGAKVDFVDIDKDSLNISISTLKEKLEEAARSNSLPKIVIPVDFAGAPVPQKEICQLSAEFGFKVIEDASHAIGASSHGEPVGSCKWADITVFSFHPVKIITTGEGGVAVTNDPELFQRMQLFRNHGITRVPEMQRQKGQWYYEQIDLGFNYRLTDLQAALGLSQIERLENYIEKRQSLADRYDRLLADLPVRLPIRADNIKSAWHLYVIRLEDKSKRRAVYDHLRSSGIGVNVHYIPVHLQPFYRKMGFKKGYCPVAEDYYERAITLPLFPTMKLHEQDKIADTLREVLA